jgi:DNA-binding SARP family transcriptional activator
MRGSISNGSGADTSALEAAGFARPRGDTAIPADLALNVFDSFPYGIVVVTRAGRVLAYNATAARLLGDRSEVLTEPADHGLCDVVGCGERGSPLEGVCLFERAIDAGETLPEVRVDLPAGAGVPAAWVTAAPLEAGTDCVIVELRPGKANDRRRRTDPHWTQGPRLRIRALGRTRVDSAEGPIGGRWLDNRAGQLLKYLVAERRRVVYPDEIVETLWADAGLQSLPGVRYFVHDLRDRLEPQRPRRGNSSFVARMHGGYMLDRTRVTIDADDFERLVRAGLAALEEDDRDQAMEHLQQGVLLYEGDFLADEPYAEWATAERDRLRAVAADALRALTDLRLAAGDIEGAAADLERLSELEPYDVDVHRKLIAVALRRGRRTDAVRRYAALRRRMLATFGEDLEFTLADVHAA